MAQDKNGYALCQSRSLPNNYIMRGGRVGQEYEIKVDKYPKTWGGWR